jgi:putative endonuclease
MAKHLQLGLQGEELARLFLEEKGYKVVAQNWRFKHKEIDLIALHGSFLVIIEVKTRSSNKHGDIEDFISYQKVSFLADAANAYIEKLSGDFEIRFDVISIILKDETEPKIIHLESAFHP